MVSFWRMSTRWKKDEGGSLVIQETGSPWIKLFGLPFAAGGIYFLYHFIVGAYYSIRSNALLGFIPGSLLLLFMMALFGAPGMILLFGSRKTRLNAASKQIEMIRNYGFYSKKESHSAGDYQSVQALHELKKVESRKDRTTKSVEFYPVRLIHPSGKHLEIALADRQEDARSLATEAGVILGLPVTDHTADWDSGSPPSESEE